MGAHGLRIAMESMQDQHKVNSKRLTLLRKNKKLGDKAYDVWINYRSRLGTYIRARLKDPSSDPYPPVKPDAAEPEH